MAQRVQVHGAITNLLMPRQQKIPESMPYALFPALVIASKIFRFCSPEQGVAVDRHASYFFNSLEIIGRGPTTHFARQWVNGKHTSSRLDIYTRTEYAATRTEYLTVYLPALACVARAMNAIPAR